MSEFVYVIAYVKGDELCGPVKIGITRSPSSRLATVQTGNPHKMAYAALLMLPNRALAERVESEAHAVVSYTRGRMSGEWFEAEPDHAVTVVCQIVDHFLNEEYEDARQRKSHLEASGVERFIALAVLQ